MNRAPMINQNITFHLPKYNSNKRGREGGGRGAAENFTWGAELIKCIDPNEGEALRRRAVERGGRGRGGWKGGEGQGRGGGRKFYLGGGIDQMY